MHTKNLHFIKALLIVAIVAGCMPVPATGQEQRSKQNANAQPKPSASNPEDIALVRQAAHSLKGDARDYDPLMQMIGDARFVLLGEATHGTHEFYRERARITQRLIEEKGFNAIVLEADWPDAYRVNEYVRGRGEDQNAEQALANFKRFPRWMWRNTDIRDFVEWIRTHNGSRESETAHVGVYGMDLYSIYESADAVVNYLKSVDPEAAKRARKRYNCLSGYRSRPEAYGYDVASGVRSSCEKQTVAQLEEMDKLVAAWRSNPNRKRDDALVSAFHNARVVRHGEAYYRLMYYQNFSTWNLRDSHMANTIQELARDMDAVNGRKTKVVVWAHNTHQGDARMTAKGERGELNVGHLMRQFHDGSTVLVGFTTYTGEELAASEWGAGVKKMKIRPAIDESYSALFHNTGLPSFLLIFRNGGQVAEMLGRPREERAIGVVYMPRTERRSHYFTARLSRQFDAVIHWDVTSAVEPLK